MKLIKRKNHKKIIFTLFLTFIFLTSSFLIDTIPIFDSITNGETVVLAKSKGSSSGFKSSGGFKSSKSSSSSFKSSGGKSNVSKTTSGFKSGSFSSGSSKSSSSKNSSSSSSSSSKSSSSSSTSGNFKSGSYSSSVDKGKSGTTKGFSSGSYSSKNDTDTTQDKDYNSSTSYDDSGGSFFGDMMFGLNSLRMFSYGRGGRGFSIGSIIIMAVIFMIVIKLIRLYLKNRKY